VGGGHPNAMLFTEIPVLTGPVNGVAMHGFRIAAKPLLVRFDLTDEITGYGFRK
jgi:hypothetical protein